MTKRELKPIIEKYMNKWVKRLRLGEFDYTVSFENLKGDYAQVSTDEDARHVSIQFNPRLLKTKEEVENTVIHELLHARINDYTELAEEIIKTHINSPKTRKLLTSRLRRLEHKILVPITDALSKEK